MSNNNSRGNNSNRSSNSSSGSSHHQSSSLLGQLPPPPPPASSTTTTTTTTHHHHQQYQQQHHGGDGGSGSGGGRMMVDSMGFPVTSGTRTTSLPPPPPPPPSSVSSSSLSSSRGSGSRSTRTSSSGAGGGGGSAAAPSTATIAIIPPEHPHPPPPPPAKNPSSPLPPPPIMKKTSKNKTTSTTTRTTASSSSSSSTKSAADSTSREETESLSTTTTPRMMSYEVPEALPLTTFAPKPTIQQQQGGGGDVGISSMLAKRQTHIPILVVATEAAHQMAWKSNLHLTDLFEGLVQSVGSSSGSSGSGGSSSSTSGVGGVGSSSVTGSVGSSSATGVGNIFNNNSLPPFRSISRSLVLDWENIKVTFIPAEIQRSCQPMLSDDAQHLLQMHAVVQDIDGDLNHELDLLEDQVDNLLQQQQQSEFNNGSEPSSSSSSYGDERRSSTRDEIFEQVVLDAYSLTSPMHIPWLWRYRQALDASTAYGPSPDADYMGCPPLCLAVCTTHEQQGMTGNSSHHGRFKGNANEGGNSSAGSNTNTNTTSTSSVHGMIQTIEGTLRALQSQHHLPTPFTNGTYDPAALRYEVLVLHDNVDGPNTFHHSHHPSHHHAAAASGSTSAATAAAAAEAQLMSVLHRSFGPGSTLLRINSITTETAIQLAHEETSDLWGGGGKRGNCLSVSDRLSIRKYLATTLIASSLLPAMERRIADLNVIVSERKKGVRNVLKSFWRGTTGTSSSTTTSGGGGIGNSSHGSFLTGTSTHGGSGSIADDELATGTSLSSSNIVQYRYDTIESQTRLLGDTLFLMKDYDNALSTYRLIRDDYKNSHNKAHTIAHHASIQEIIAICMYIIDPYNRTREVFTHIERALLGYNRSAELERNTRIRKQQQQQQRNNTGLGSGGGGGSIHNNNNNNSGTSGNSSSSNDTSERPGRHVTSTLSTRLATRLCLVLAGTKNLCSGRHVEVADLLASASSHETSLGSAVLLEQSSSHYYYANMYRKYAFHMLMSGHMFRSANQDHHAFRCFTSALYIYKDSQWYGLYDHIRSALATQLYSMNRLTIAMQLYTKLVGVNYNNNYNNKSGNGTNGGGGGGCRLSIKSQQKFINHILEICNEENRTKALVAADRMVVAAQTTTTTTGRGMMMSAAAIRQERFDRIVQVVQSTKGATRVLELPNVDLPGVDDSSVVVLAEEAAASPEKSGSGGGGGISSSSSSTAIIADASSATALGNIRRGSQDIWDDLMLEATAELRAVDVTTTTTKKKTSGGGDDEIMNTKILSKISDIGIRNVIGYIDKEKASRAITERSKRSSYYKPTPPIRALMEPYKVEFIMFNPLGIPIHVTRLQLVAKMNTTMTMTTANDNNKSSSSSSGNDNNNNSKLLWCTNEDAIKITTLVSYDKPKIWSFHSSEEEFEVADFCRVTSTQRGKARGRAGDDDDDDGDDLKNRTWKSAEEVDPFFVVTKKDISFKPEERKTISISICPLVQGNLEIIGIRYRLLNTVWIYHPFNIKGPLLQNTRSNRINRVRGESLLLKAIVQRGMPCLSAQLVEAAATTTTAAPSPQQQEETGAGGGGGGGPVLQGQISRWILRIANIGTATATNVCLKTNVPWVSIDTSEDSGDGGIATPRTEQDATSFCVGPTGTLMRLPIRGVNLKAEGCIDPGETVDIPINIRSSGNGKQDFYMLFRYELPSDPGETPRNRWLRKMFEVPVYPSLTMAASIMPSFSTQGEHILSVELTNFRTDRPDNLHIFLDRLCLASRRYRLEPLPGQLPSRDDPSYKDLGWQERATLHYRVVLDRNNGDDNNNKKKDDLVVSKCSLSSSDDDKDGSGGGGGVSPAVSDTLLNFLCLERAHEQFVETLRSHQAAVARAAASQGGDDEHPRSISQIRRANTTLSTDSDVKSTTGSLGGDGGGSTTATTTGGITATGEAIVVHPTSLAKLCPIEASDEAVHLVCTWSNHEQGIAGEHHIRSLSVRPGESTKGCPITVTAKHPTKVLNDFTTGPATVPFEVTLRNRLVRSAVDFEFSVERSETFDFTGPECFKVSELGGGQEVSIPLSALIPTSGVYNLQRVRLTIYTGEPVSFLFPLQWLVTVCQTS